MKLIVRFAPLLFLLAVISVSTTAQIAPVCDAGCGGPEPSNDPSGVLARTALASTRGAGTPSRPSFSPLPLRVPRGVTVEGSQSFTYAVPLFHLPGRNGLNVDLTLYYNSFIWTVVGNSIVLNADHDNPSPGFRLDFGYVEFDGNGNVVLVEGSGDKHLMVPGSSTNTFVSVDSSYIQAQINYPIGNVILVTYRNGLIATYVAAPGNASFFRPGQYKDTNGNIFSIIYQDNSSLRISQIIDDVGRKLNFAYDSAVPTQLNSITELSAGNIAFRTYTFSWAQNYPLYFAFTKNTGTLHSGAFNPSRINVLTGVTRADGTRVQFDYADWGLVSQVSERSANGAIRYSTSYNWPIAGNGFQSANPTYTQQTIFDGVNTGVWIYAAQRNPAGTITSSSVTNPLGAVTATTFSVVGDGLDGVPIQQLLCSASPCAPGSSTVLRTTNTNWELDTQLRNPRKTSITTILEDGSTQSQVKYTAYDANGNLTGMQEYDFGNGAPGALLRETVTTYAAPGSGILNKPSRLIVKDGSGTIISRTDMSYDEGHVADFAANPAGHDPAYTSVVTARGNLTSMIQYANPGAGTGGITTTLTYDATGNVLTSKTGSGPQTQKNFSTANWYAFPDSISAGPAGNQLTTSFTYNDDGDVLVATDANGQPAHISYDVAGRPITAQTPDLVTATTSYDDNSANPTVRNASSANSLILTSTSDGLGRLLSKQTASGTLQGPLVQISTVTQANDILGRPTQISLPFGPSETPVYTSYVYDTLGRPTQVTPPAVGAATQNPYQTTYAGNVATTTDPAGLRRKQYYDSLGRLTRVDEPGALGGAVASASVTIAGTVLSVPSNSASNGATAGTANINLAAVAPCSPSIADRCNTQVVQQAAASASVMLTLGGADGSNRSCVTNPRTGRVTCTLPVADTGSFNVSMNIGGTVVNASVTYGGTDTPATLASRLFQNFPVNAVVNVSNPNGGNTVTFSAKATGAALNGSSIAASFVSNCVDTDILICTMGWTGSLSGPNLAPTVPAGSAAGIFTGGLDQILTTKYDTGTITVGFTANNGTAVSEQVSYGQNDTAATLAQAFMTKFSQDAAATPYVVAACSNSNCSDGLLKLTTVATGSGTNYPLTLSAATNSSYFAAGSTSFNVTSPSTTFTPGQPGIVYDNGTVTLTLNGFTSGTAPKETATYSQGSTAAGVAASLVAKINSDPLWGAVIANVPAGSTTITVTARNKGTDANSYSLTLTGASALPGSFPNPSFPNSGSSAPITAAMSGGAAPTPSFDPTVVLATTYRYDPLGHLLQVNQGQQTRTYVYDGLGRLLSAALPETGNSATTYTYTDFGALATRTDNRPATAIGGPTLPFTKATYSYDVLGRLIDVSYNDTTPEVTFTFGAAGAANNGAGRLISTTDGSGSKSFQYDVMGRATQQAQTIGGVTYTTRYVYNPAGSLSSTTYPSGRIVAQQFDNIGRFTEVDNNGSAVYRVGSYNAAGQALGMTFGNGMTGAYAYNSQSQLAAIQYNNGTAPIFSLAYAYGGASNNSQIQSITDNVNPARSTSYSYDELGRVQTGQTVDLTSANTWKLRFTYDRYGNRLSQVPVGGAGLMPMSEVFVDPTTNHLFGSGQAYDAAGNMTSDGLHSYTFDAENRITRVDGSANLSVYDGNGFRVRKNGTIYLFSGGKVIAEYAAGAAPASPSAEYIYARGRRVATIAAGAITYHYSDHLSIRSSANASGSVTREYAPYLFGETWYEIGSTSKWKFTTFERDADSEGGLDYAIARFDSTRIGRFMSLDPMSGSIANPQSLNKYTYVGNDPVNMIDPKGAFTGNFFCLLNDLGDCTTGNYSGYWWMDPMGAWGGMSNGRGGCSVDGQALDCRFASSGLNSGFFTQCPNNICYGTNGLGMVQQFRSTIKGDYWATLAVGTFDNVVQAGIAAVLSANAMSIAMEMEYSGNVYKTKDGSFSFTLPQGGTKDSSTFDPSAVPDGTWFAGAYHTHGDPDPHYDNDQFSPQDIGLGLGLDPGGLMFLGTPDGQIEIFNPSLFNLLPWGCVLVGSPVTPGPGVSSVPVPKC